MEAENLPSTDAPDTQDTASNDASEERERALAEREQALAAREAEIARQQDAADAAARKQTEDAQRRTENPAVQERLDKGFYCPGCGRAYSYQRECTGTATAPHPTIEVVASDELTGEPDRHTAAPDTTT